MTEQEIEALLFSFQERIDQISGEDRSRRAVILHEELREVKKVIDVMPENQALKSKLNVVIRKLLTEGFGLSPNVKSVLE